MQARALVANTQPYAIFVQRKLALEQPELVL